MINNENDREAARKALEAYRETRNHTDADDADIADLMADLAHLMDLLDADNAGYVVLETASRNYEVERSEAEDEIPGTPGPGALPH